MASNASKRVLVKAGAVFKKRTNNMIRKSCERSLNTEALLQKLQLLIDFRLGFLHRYEAVNHSLTI